MRTLIRSFAVVLLVTLLVAAVAFAASPFTTIPVSVTVDSTATESLVADPSTVAVDGIRPGDQMAWDVVVTNVGTTSCGDILITQRRNDPYLDLQSWPTGTLAPLEEVTVRLLVTLDEDAPDVTTREMVIGVVCVR